MSLLPLLLTLFLVSSITLGQEPKKIEDFWNETIIDRSLIESVVNDENCYLGEQEFVACMEVLQYAFDLETKAIKSKTGQSFKNLSFQSNGYRDCGVSICTSSNSWNRIEDIKKRRAHYLKYWDQGYEFNFSFDKELKNYLDIIKREKPRKFKLYIADMYNSYLRIAKAPHSRIKPSHFINEIYPLVKPTGTVYYDAGVNYIEVSGGVLITKVAFGSPAFSAGIVSGDIVLTPTNTRADRLFRGEFSSKRTLTLRDGFNSSKEVVLDFKATPKHSMLSKVSFHILNRSDEIELGYIKIKTFSERGVCNSVEQSLKIIRERRITKLILDLRSNGGGFISEANCIAGLFLGKGKVTSIQLDHNADIVRKNKTTKNKVYFSEMIILMNGGSASSSELLAAALIEYNRAIVVGSLSYGKGTYQSPSNFKYPKDRDKSIKSRLIDYFLKEPKKSITIHETGGLFLTPNGKSVQVHGITPHVSLPEVDYKGQVKAHTRQRSQYLYPLKPREPMCDIDERECYEDDAIACLSQRASLIDQTIQNHSPITFLLDKQLAQTMFIFDCYQQN